MSAGFPCEKTFKREIQQLPKSGTLLPSIKAFTRRRTRNLLALFRALSTESRRFTKVARSPFHLHEFVKWCNCGIFVNTSFICASKSNKAPRVFETCILLANWLLRFVCLIVGVLSRIGLVWMCTSVWNEMMPLKRARMLWKDRIL